MVIDFFYRDAFERSVVNFAAQKVILPGQVWLLPGVGPVLVQEVDAESVTYLATTPGTAPNHFEPGEFNAYRASRRDFTVWCRDPQEISAIDDDEDGWPEEDSHGDDNVIQLSPRNSTEP